ncbi:unnamed protein product [Gordionus sp. m RMFG-2023]|uniref:venom protein 302-like n=1 Tax=Gordionus sp. m RMFG-2023 TaxID=3053472 RepID=UPI0030E4F6E4
MALDCSCQRLPVNCGKPPPINCKAGLVKDACDCCFVCAKVKGELCGGPSFTKGRCANGLICYMSFEQSIQSEGRCVLAARRISGEPCGDAWQQGDCTFGLICSQITPGKVGRCTRKKNS